MGKLYDTVQAIERVIGADHLEPFKTKGMISIKVGFALGLVKPETPDDPGQIAKLKAAALEVLHKAV